MRQYSSILVEDGQSLSLQFRLKLLSELRVVFALPGPLLLEVQVI